MSRSARCDAASIESSRVRIEVLLIDRRVDQLLVKLVDELAGSVPEVVPHRPGRLVAATEPLHRGITRRFGVPSCRRVITQQHLIEQHFEQDHWIVGNFANARVGVVDQPAIHCVDLTFDNFGVVIAIDFLAELSPLR